MLKSLINYEISATFCARFLWYLSPTYFWLLTRWPALLLNPHPTSLGLALWSELILCSPARP